MKWDKEKLHKEARKYSRRVDFQRLSASAYVNARKQGILEEICSHMEKCLKYWTNEDLLEEARKYKTRMDMRKNNYPAYCRIHKRKIQETCFYHMDSVRKKWDRESVLKEVEKYKTRKDFEEGSVSAYCASIRLKMGDEIRKILYYKMNNWTNEDLACEAKKFKTRGEFYRKSPAKHLISCRRGILEEICNHMKRSGSTSSGELELLDIVKQVHPNVYKLKKRNITIEDKPYIKGFDIDIFIPDIKKGIEYDGKYYHSIDFMIKNKKHWKEEDVLKYHEIKDNYFNTLGIEILHIKELDWINDREGCISKIKEFIMV